LDTIGLLLRDPRDLAPIAHVLFGVPFGAIPKAPRIGYVGPLFLVDCDPEVQAAFVEWRKKMAAAGGSLAEIETGGWSGLPEAYSGIVAHEAAALHRGEYEEFDSTIAQRLHWGASLTEVDLAAFERGRADLHLEIAALFERFDFLMLPCAPVSRLVAGQDHSSVRLRILRYTTPFSLAGLPAVAMPGEVVGAALGTGVQIAAAPGNDAVLLAYAGMLARTIVDASG
jgi:Asp-tRNA(Asn)/Glu-tRNA(Gln) amidotransferase A subunit family amidase